jgi:transposase
VVAGDADGDGEGDPVGVDACLPGGLGFQGAERLIDGEEREQLLADQLRRPGPQDEAGAAFLEDLRRIDAQLRDAKKRLTAAVRASGTTITEVFGVGPVIAATMIGYVADGSRFPTRDRFAAYNGTAPIEVSSGNRNIYRLSRRGNRRLNHAVHMAAVTQIRQPHSDGRAYYDRKIAEGGSVAATRPARPSASCRKLPAGSARRCTA